jgi:hypothetical protein
MHLVTVPNLEAPSKSMQALSRVPRKPTHWYRYVDDAFVVWPHGEEELHEFLDQLYSIHHNIKFTMEVEKTHL